MGRREHGEEHARVRRTHEMGFAKQLPQCGTERRRKGYRGPWCGRSALGMTGTRWVRLQALLPWYRPVHEEKATGRVGSVAVGWGCQRPSPVAAAKITIESPV